MGERTGIAWTDATWNPIVGCSVVSPGCTNCYAMRMAARLERVGQPIYAGMTRQTKAGAVWSGRVEASNWGQIIRPLSWRRPRRIFVNSMSDLFHPALPDEVRDTVFAVMANCPQHQFQVLTKRPDVMREYMAGQWRVDAIYAQWSGVSASPREMEAWPLPNVWLGTSVEDRERVGRIDDLRETSAAVRFISFEPLLGDVGAVDLSGIDWAIIGGESGPGARSMRREWAEHLLRQCADAGVAAFFKQVGSNRGYPGIYDQWDEWPGVTGKGDNPEQWPASLRVQEFPG